jgi:DNA modification methylase
MVLLQTKKKLKPHILDFVETNDVYKYKNRLYASSFDLLNNWKNQKRSSSHSLHGMASRTGSFPAGLASYFINRFSLPKQNILDPFSGKGTTALEACLNQRRGIGIDIAPEAYILTAAKIYNISIEDSMNFLDKLPKEKISLRNIPNEVKVFFHNDVLKQILGFRKNIEQYFSLKHLDYKICPLHEQRLIGHEAKLAKYWTGVLLGILHGSSNDSLSLKCSHSYSMSPKYVEKYAIENNLVKPQKDIYECLKRKSSKLLENGNIKIEGRSILGSAMDIPIELNNSIDLIFTSPPYFAAQNYSWDNWLREWYLGFDYKDVRAQSLETSSEHKYRKAIFQHLQNAFKALKNDCWAFYVAGDIIKKSKTGSYKLITAEIIAQEAEKVGFTVELIINDDIPSSNRYFSSYLSEDQGVKLDRIVCLYKI